MTRTLHDRLRRGQPRNLHSCAWSITTAAVPSSSCSAAWCPRCYAQGRPGDTPERRTLMFRSTLKSPAAQYKPPVWNKRCATPSLSRTPSASGDGISPTHPECGPLSSSSYSPTSLPSRRGQPSNSLGVIGFCCESPRYGLCREGHHDSPASGEGPRHVAFVLLNNEHGDALTAAVRVREVFGEPTGAIRTQLQDLRADFADSSTQGTSAYVNQITLDHPEIDPRTAAADAILAVGIFADSLLAV